MPSWYPMSQYIFLNVNVSMIVPTILLLRKAFCFFLTRILQGGQHCPDFTDEHLESSVWVKACLGQNSSLYQLASNVSFPNFPFCL